MPRAMAEQLRRVFAAFAGGGGTEMDGRAFTKCLKDSGLLTRPMTTTDADLIFAKYKPKGARKIDFAGFSQCLTAVAEKRGVDPSAVEEQVCSSRGPNFSEGTTATATGGAEKFFYDQSGYTGTHARGGPSAAGSGVARDGYADLSGLINRDHVQDDAMNRRKQDGAAGDVESQQRRTSDAGMALLRNAMSMADAEARPPSAKAAPKAAAAGAAKVAPKAASARGPERFFYDKNSYTGVHKAGGPTNLDGPVRTTLDTGAAPASAPGSARPKAGAKTNPARGPERFFYDQSTYTGVAGHGGAEVNSQDAWQQRLLGRGGGGPQILDTANRSGGVGGYSDLSQMTRTGLNSGRTYAAS